MTLMHARTAAGPQTVVVAIALVAVAPSLGAPPSSAEAAPPIGDNPDAPAVAQAPVSTLEELGRLLFWDPILSGNMDVACATCHHPDFAYADGRELALGTGSVGLGPARASAPGSDIAVVPRNAPTILNVGLNGLERRNGRGRRGRRGDEFGIISLAMDRLDPEEAPMFWDSRVESLEAQALEPLKVREEMRGDAYAEEVAVDSVVARLRGVSGYVRMFGELFGIEGQIEAIQVAEAISAFERTLKAVDSPFDRYLAGDSAAMTPQQIRGMNEFDNARCTQCHDGPMLSDFDRHAEGVAENELLNAADVGDGRFRFRTPSLRNVALTSPYMHNGTLATLDDVLEFYDDGDSLNPNVLDRGRRRGGDGQRGPTGVLDNDFRQVRNMSNRDMADIVAFLEALTDSAFDRTIPESVPSGLTPGGSIGAKPAP